MSSRLQKWAKAEKLYAASCRLMEANMDQLDIGCGTYQQLYIQALELAGLPGHTPHCSAQSCMNYCLVHARSSKGAAQS